MSDRYQLSRKGIKVAEGLRDRYGEKTHKINWSKTFKLHGPEIYLIDLMNRRGTGAIGWHYEYVVGFIEQALQTIYFSGPGGARHLPGSEGFRDPDVVIDRLVSLGLIQEYQWDEEDFKEKLKAGLRPSESTYAVLELDSSATPEEVRQAYLRLAKKYHPDVNKDPGSTEKMQKINQAYSELKLIPGIEEV